MRTLVLSLSAFLLLLAGASTVARASLVRALSLNELVAQAEHIVVIKVLRQESRWDGQRRIVTDATVRVDEKLKGALRVGQETTFRRLGGVVGDIGMRVEGEPMLETGARYLVFARRVDGALRAVGMSQGVLAVTDANGRSMVRPNNAGVLLVQPTNGQVAPAPPPIAEPTPLDDVAQRVTGLVGSSR